MKTNNMEYIFLLSIIPFFSYMCARKYHAYRTKKWLIKDALTLIPENRQETKMDIQKYIETNIEFLKSQYKRRKGGVFRLNKVSKISDLVYEQIQIKTLGIFSECFLLRYQQRIIIETKKS